MPVMVAALSASRIKSPAVFSYTPVLILFGLVLEVGLGLAVFSVRFSHRQPECHQLARG
jgi:hypothetical protein